jgi:hypothetical protein
VKYFSQVRLFLLSDAKFVGKLEGVVSGHRRGDDTCDEESQEKVDSLQLEFTYLLTTQLESQRFYFEERLAAQSKELQRNLEKHHIRLEFIRLFKKIVWLNRIKCYK